MILFQQQAPPPMPDTQTFGSLTVTKIAEDRAEQYKREPDRAAKELEIRLKDDLRRPGDFSRIHPMPASGADVPDDLDARLLRATRAVTRPNVLELARRLGIARGTAQASERWWMAVASSPVAVPGIQPTLPVHSGSTSANGFSARAGFEMDLAKDTMAFATYSRGYKGPAYNVFFNMLNRDTLALKPETSDSFELGLKASAFDRKLTANLAVFSTKYQNCQANFYDTVAGAVVTRAVASGQHIKAGERY